MIRWYNVNSRNRISYWFYIIKKKICISLHYNGSNSFLFVYATKVYQFKVKKKIEIKDYALCLGNVSKDL